ncbi:hypothetical protein V5738_18335 [Salinisphaera sp. SPP-AMP-43]|uniref:hypothetical protein n=1 Tax=Salinisphaera sp. SPP-AMP-43 TaxID=3121288 RepID=UPI003C6E7A1C
MAQRRSRPAANASPGPAGARRAAGQAKSEMPAVSTTDKLAFLRQLEPGSELRETHMSWVVLGPHRVLKMKKPVRYSFLDFSTLAAREHFCHQEVHLNRRLAAGVYLGVRAVVRSGNGALGLAPASDSHDRAVEWLVEMQRLPESAMLDTALADDRVTPAQIEAVAARLARFYRSATAVDISPSAYIDRLQEQLVRVGIILTARDYMLDHGRDIRVLEAARQRIEALDRVLRERVAAGRIVDGHGDLRPEHICLIRPPAIIDCLEFNAGLRAVDPYEEVAALDMECRCLDAPWIGPILFRRLRQHFGHTPPAALIECHVALRALTRARLALTHLLEPKPRTPELWQPLARRYLAVAEAALMAGTEH